jgi:hypothetical protein
LILGAAPIASISDSGSSSSPDRLITPTVLSSFGAAATVAAPPIDAPMTNTCFAPSPCAASTAAWMSAV